MQPQHIDLHKGIGTVGIEVIAAAFVANRVTLQIPSKPRIIGAAPVVVQSGHLVEVVARPAQVVLKLARRIDVDISVGVDTIGPPNVPESNLDRNP